MLEEVTRINKQIKELAPVLNSPTVKDAATVAVVDLTRAMGPDGILRWDAPPGEWEVLRFGSTLNDHCRLSTSSEDWGGHALDPFDARPFDEYWRRVVEPLIDDAGPLSGRHPVTPEGRYGAERFTLAAAGPPPSRRGRRRCRPRRPRR